MKKFRVVSTLISLFMLVNLLLPAAGLAVAPVVTLVSPTAVAPAVPTLQSGAVNQIQVNATSTGSTISSVQWQSQFAGPPGAFTALEIFAQIPLVVGTPIAGAGARADATPVPAGLPAGTIANFTVEGVVTAVNAATGEFQIGTPPVFVYQTATTVLRRSAGITPNPVVGDLV